MGRQLPVCPVRRPDRRGPSAARLIYFSIQCKAMQVPIREAKLSSKNQIVVPREARNALGLKSGDRLLVVVRRDAVILLRRPKKYSRAISGIGGSLYPPGYLQSERKSWA